MAFDFTVGGPSTNSFGSVEDADAYFADRGIEAWSGENSVKEAALLVGADYILNTYRGQWCFTRSDSNQALPFPAKGVVDADGRSWADDVIPPQVAHAQFQAALQHVLGVDLMPVVSAGGKIVSERAGAGPAQSSTTFADHGPGTGEAPKFPIIERLLSGLVTGNSGGFGSMPLARG